MRMTAVLSSWILPEESMNNPYSDLPAACYWKTGVAEQHPMSIEGLYRKKFWIGSQMKIATAGSCFAQHIGRHLKGHGYVVLDVEPPPSIMSEQTAVRFGYGIYSARYGNIYTSRQLLQLAKAALGVEARPDVVWERGGRYFDALRPAVEPDGFGTVEEVLQHRNWHLQRVGQLLKSMDLFIFTLGLTETWMHRESGTVYPTAPGVIAGEYDPKLYEMRNLTHREVLDDMIEFRRLVKSVNAGVKFLLTVSPVPLTATASHRHVLVATTYSKSVLRGVAGELEARYRDVDYFPSYELIASPFSRGFFYSPNLRSIEADGVKAVMRVFSAEHRLAAPKQSARRGLADPEAAHELMCEEVLLEAFAR